MANRLLRYELLLFRASFAAAFDRARDKTLLLVVLVVGAFWLKERIAGASALTLPPSAIWLALLAAPAGFGWQRLIRARLDWLAEHSALAAPALAARTRRAYLVAAHLLVAIPLLSVAALLGIGGWALAALAYATGTGLASIARKARSAEEDAPVSARRAPARQPAFRAILRRQTLDSARPGRAAAALVAATFALTFLAAWLSRGQPDALRFAAILSPPLLALLLTSRADAELIGFLPFAGYRPGFVAVAVSALPAACLAASALAVVAVRPHHAVAILIILLLLHLAFILTGIARAWLYAGRSGRSVDLQVQMEFAGLVLIAALLPPLALAALAWRLWMLRRHYASLLWTQL